MLARISRRARVLFSGTAYSKCTCGYQTAGLSLAHWNKVEIAAANAAGFKAGRCRYSALGIAYAYSGHPFARAIKELFVFRFKIIVPLVNSRDPILVDVEGAWQTTKITIDTNPPNPFYPGEGQGEIRVPFKAPTFGNSLQKVNGIMSAVFFLVCLVWKPVSLLEWDDTEWETWALTPSDDAQPLSNIINALVRCYHLSKLPDIQKH